MTPNAELAGGRRCRDGRPGRARGRSPSAHHPRRRVRRRRLLRVAATSSPGRPVHVALGTVANKQGRVAGINLGGGYATFPGVVGTAITKVCCLEVARTGLTEREAAEAGFETGRGQHRHHHHRRVHARRRPMTREAGGRAGHRPAARRARSWARGGSAKRIDTVATALHARLRVADLIDLDLAYAPPFSSAWDPDPHRRPPAASASWADLADCGMAAGLPARGPRRTIRPSPGAPCAAAYSELVDELAGGPARRRGGGVRRRGRGPGRRRRLRPGRAEPPVRHRRGAPPRRPLRHRHARRPHLVPDLGRGPEARPRRAHAAGGPHPRRRRPRHRHLAAPGPPRRRRRGPHRRPRPARPSRSGRSGPSAGSPSCPRRVRGPACRTRARWPSCSSPTSRKGGAACATCTRCAGRRRRAACCGTGDDRRLERRLRGAARRPGSSCTAAPVGPATGCCSRSRTRWPRALGDRRRPTPSCTALAAAARTIAWRSDDAWQRIDASLTGPLGWRSRRDKAIGPGLVLRDGEVHLTADADPWPTRPSSCEPPRPRPAARHPHPPRLARPAGRSSARRSRTRGRRRCGPRWSTCSSPGHRAIPVIEALDQMGLWALVLPEWDAVRSKPQRNAYHRFTVDRHLMETAANAAGSGRPHRAPRPARARRPAPRHRQGVPGRPHRRRHRAGGRHRSPDGVSRRRTSRCSRRWCATTCCCPTSPPGATSTTRPPSTVWPRRSATCSRSGCSAALTEADSLATGPAAWGQWKADLVRDLVGRTAHVLGGGTAEEVRDDFPTAEHLDLLRCGTHGAARRGRPPHGRRRRPAGPVQPGHRRAGAARARRARRRRHQPRRHGPRGAAGGVELRPHHRLGQGAGRPRAGPRGPPRPAGPPGRAGPRLRRARPVAGPAPRAAVGGGRQRAPRGTPPWWRSTPSTPSASCTGSPGPSPSSTSTSCRPRCRPSATGSSTPSTSAICAGDKLTDPATLVEVERALLHELVS